jgi:hypothetical protein
MTTREAIEELGITEDRLRSLIRSGRLAPPKKNGSGDLVWTSADIARARAALGNNRRKGSRAAAVTA